MRPQTTSEMMEADTMATIVRRRSWSGKAAEAAAVISLEFCIAEVFTSVGANIP